MMIAREGIWIIAGFFVLTTILLVLALKLDSLLVITAAALFSCLTIFTTYFFRDPVRKIAVEEGVVLSPADGRVVRIAELEDHPHIGGPAKRVSVFLSAFDVHINRIPVSGVIDYVHYVPGKYSLAWRDKASLDNERTEIGMITATGHRVAFSQIAGTVARRIVCYLNAGDSVVAGERFGMIRFGSRMDVFVSSDTPLDVEEGDRVKAGLNVIARLSVDARHISAKSKPEEKHGH